MNEKLKNMIDICIKNKKNLPQDDLYVLCKKEIYKFEKDNRVSCSEYDRFIKYICDEIDY